MRQTCRESGSVIHSLPCNYVRSIEANRGESMKSRTPYRSPLVLIGAVALALAAPLAAGQGRGALEADAQRVYSRLVATVPAAKAVSAQAVAVLVFPKITKAGFMVGGQYGDGVLLKEGKAAGYYNTTGASYGLQAGAQQFGYAMFFMN